MQLDNPSSKKDLLYLRKGTGKLCTIKDNECVLYCSKDSILFFNVTIFNAGYFESEKERDEFIDALYEVLRNNFVMFKNDNLSENDCTLLYDCIKTFIIALTSIKKPGYIKDYIKQIKKSLRRLR